MSRGTVHAVVRLFVVIVPKLQLALDGRFGEAGAVGNVTDRHSLLPKRSECVEVVTRLNRADRPLVAEQVSFEWLGIRAVEATGLFEMDLEAGALLSQKVGRPTEPDHCVEHVLLSGSLPLCA